MSQQSDSMRVAVIVPVRNGGEVWRRAAAAIRAQRRRPERVLVVDSESSDGSDEVAQQYGFELLPIAVRDFDHGGTRQLAAEHCADCDVLVYLTQDAVLADPDALGVLLRAFDDEQVAVAYGRQLPRREAGPIEAHARLFNYPPESARRTLADVAKLGLKTAFTSDSYCAYRGAALAAVGGFPRRAIVSEDMIVAAKALQAGKAVRYVGESCVYHSHGYSIREDFRRYFDIGVFHHDQPWLLATFGKPEGEGLRFVRSELLYLLRNGPLKLLEAMVRTLAKYVAYQGGRHYFMLPPRLRRIFSSQSSYWGGGGVVQ